MITRKRIEAKINAKIDKMESIHAEIIELKKQSYLLSDKTQWFEEKEETKIITRRPMKTETCLVGRIYWKEKFEDESTGKYITVDRSRIVRQDGEWI